jgi:hypothetical protein
MLIVVICLAHTLWPTLVALLKDTEIHAAVMALGVFAFVVLRLPRPPLPARRVVS